MKKFLVLGALSLFCFGGDVSAMNGNINAGPQVNNTLSRPLDGMLVDYQEKLNTIIRKGLEYTGALGQAERLHNMLQNVPDASCFYPPWREFIRAQCDIDEAAIEFKGAWGFITNNAIPQPDIRKEASATIRRARAIFVERLANANTPATIREAIETYGGGLRLDEELNLDTLTRAELVEMLETVVKIITEELNYIYESIKERRNSIHASIGALDPRINNGWLEGFFKTVDSILQTEVKALKQRYDANNIAEVNRLRELDRQLDEFNNCRIDLQNAVQALSARYLAETDAYFDNLCASGRLFTQRTDIQTHIQRAMDERLARCQAEVDTYFNEEDRAGRLSTRRADIREHVQRLIRERLERYPAEMNVYFDDLGASDRLFTQRTDIQTRIQRATDNLLASCRAEVDTYFNEEDRAGTLLTRRADIQEHVQRLIRERLARCRAEVDTYFNNADSILTFFSDTEDRIYQTIDFLNEMPEDVH